MSFSILGLAHQSPEYSLGQESTAQFAKGLCCSSEQDERLLDALYRRTRIRKRGSVLLNETGGMTSNEFYTLPEKATDPGPGTRARMQKYEDYSSGLAVSACRRALKKTNLSASEITHLITVTCTGFFSPGIDYQICREMNLDSDIHRIQIGFMGCHAALNALGVASGFAAADPTARVLICAVELCSLHFQYGWNPDRVVSNAIFADGAGAIVGASWSPQTAEERWKLVASGSHLVDDSADAMTWRIGDNGFLMTLSANLPEIIQRQLPGWIDGWLCQHDYRRDQIKSWAIHPGGPRILTAAEKALGISPTATRASKEVLVENGNMSSATLVFVLEKMITEGHQRPCVALGFGPGLTIEAALFD